MSTALGHAGRIPGLEMRHRLYLARDFAGLSQTELADRMGASRRGVSSAETGEKEPRRSTLILWALATGGDRVHRVEVPLTLPAHCVRPSPEQPLGVAGVHREPTRCPRGHSWILDGQSCTSHWITGFDARDRGIDPHHSWACQLCGAEWHAPAGWGGDLGELRADVAGNPS